MRSALALLLVLALWAASGCGGDEAQSETTLALTERVVQAEDAPGSKPDPVETQQSTTMLLEFVDELTMRAVDPDEEMLTELFTDAGFQGAVSDTRFFGESHSPEQPHIFSSVIELESEEGAESAMGWLVEDTMKPCPETCAVEISEFDVDGIPDARGIRRTQTAEDIAARGRPDDRPFDSYTTIFADGPFVYSVDLSGSPGSVSEEQALEIATALYERVT